MSVLIECRELSKIYGNQTALNNVSFEIKAGPPVALVGPNGAGKSTLLSILSGYIKANSGQARILGQSVGSPKLIGRIGALPQDALFDPDMAILKQLSFLAQLQGFSSLDAVQESERCLDLMQLLGIKNEKINALSHGMKKRVAIAQALMGSPELVLLDEPTAGLDPENARNIRQQITALSDQITFIVSSHNLDELEKMCAHVMYLEQGELKSFQSIGDSQMIAGGQASEASQTDVIASQVDYLTLTLKQQVSVSEALASKIKLLSSVTEVLVKQGNALVIQYNRQINPELDQNLLKVLVEEGLEYRQITHGRSLEDQLFQT